MLRPAPAFVLSAALLSGCGGPRYEDAKPGRFDGQVVLVWVGPTEGPGDGKFVFVPNPDRPFRFTRPAEKGGRVITPEMMYTDGGSVPRFGQVFKGFSPWNYGPTYVIHDWLFEARHCLRDGTPDPAHEPLADLDFTESAEILAETIQTLVQDGRVKPDDVSASVVTAAVSSGPALELWNEGGLCALQKISDADREAAESAVRRGGATVGRTFAARTVRRADGTSADIPSARIIAAFTF